MENITLYLHNVRVESSPHLPPITDPGQLKYLRYIALAEHEEYKTQKRINKTYKIHPRIETIQLANKRRKQRNQTYQTHPTTETTDNDGSNNHQNYEEETTDNNGSNDHQNSQSYEDYDDGSIAMEVPDDNSTCNCGETLNFIGPDECTTCCCSSMMTCNGDASIVAECSACGYKICNKCLESNWKEKFSRTDLPPLLALAKIKKILGLGAMPHEPSRVTKARARMAKLVQRRYLNDPGLQGSIVRADFLKFITCAHAMMGPNTGTTRTLFDGGTADGKMLYYIAGATFGTECETLEVYGAELGSFFGADTCFPGRILQNTNLNQVAPWDVNIVYVFLACEEHLQALMMFLFQPGQNNTDVILALCDGYSGRSQDRWINKYLPAEEHMEILNGSTNGGSSHWCYIFALKNLSTTFRTAQNQLARRCVANTPRVCMLDSISLANAAWSRPMVRRSANERTFRFQEATKTLIATCACLKRDKNLRTMQIKQYFNGLKSTYNMKVDLIGFYMYLSRRRISAQTGVGKIQRLIIEHGIQVATNYKVQNEGDDVPSNS